MKTDDAHEQARRDVIARLAALSPLEYDAVRVDEAGGLGVRVATLDDEVAHRRKARNREPGEGQRSRWPVPTLWPEPVDGAALLTGIADFVSTYVHLPTPAASTVALWIVMTWLHDRLDLSPFLHLTSATRRCGKSALLEVIGTLVHRPLMTSHATVAAIFRLIERDAPTLLLDEIDHRFRATDATVLIGIINSSPAPRVRVYRPVHQRPRSDFVQDLVPEGFRGHWSTSRHRDGPVDRIAAGASGSWHSVPVAGS